MSKYFGVYIKLAAIKKQISVDRHEIVVHKKKGHSFTAVLCTILLRL